MNDSKAERKSKTGKIHVPTLFIEGLNLTANYHKHVGTIGRCQHTKVTLSFPRISDFLFFGLQKREMYHTKHCSGLDFN